MACGSRHSRLDLRCTLALLAAPALAALGCAEPGAERALAEPGARPVEGAARAASPLRSATTSSGWLGQVQARIASSEYAIRPAKRVGQVERLAGRLEASNRRQGLRGSWHEDRFTAARRAGADLRDNPVTLQARTLGRAGTSHAIGGGRFAPGACQTDGALDERGACLRRAERPFAGGVEWWENRREGFEHGLTLRERPEGSMGAALFVDVAVEGATVQMDPDARGARFMLTSGRALGYGQLAALDAEGVRLPVRLEAAPGGVRMLVDDSTARYPIVIDPILNAPAGGWGHESNQAEAGYAASIMQVAGAGDINNDGKADVLVAYPRFDTPAGVDSGRVFVFLGTAAGLSATPQVTLDGEAATNLFGRAVSSAGDLNGDGFADVVIGAPGYGGTVAGNAVTNQGRLYVYLGSAAGLASTPATLREGGAMNAAIGRGLAAGDVNGDGKSDLVVGLILGRMVKVYFGGDATKGLLDDATQAPWTFMGPASASFAQSVAAVDLNKDGRADVVVGSPTEDAAGMGTADNRGAFRIFMASAVAGGAAFNTALPAAPTHSVEGAAAGDGLGEVVTRAGDVNGDGFQDLLVTSLLKGRAFIFHGKATGTPPVDPGPELMSYPGSDYGVSASGAGDVNRDGFADVVVGVPAQAAGWVLLYLGAAGGIRATQPHRFEGGTHGEGLGGSVAMVGDVNGDGYADVMAAAHRYSSPETEEGRALLLLGSDGSTPDGGVDVAPPGGVDMSTPRAPTDAAGVDRAAPDATSPAGDARPADATPGVPMDARADGVQVAADGPVTPRTDARPVDGGAVGPGGSGGSSGGPAGTADGGSGRDGSVARPGDGGAGSKSDSSGCSCSVGKGGSAGAAPASLVLLALGAVLVSARARRRR